jgi:hypothetical protein
MRLPEFTAEKALGKPSKFYRARLLQGGPLETGFGIATLVAPAQITGYEEETLGTADVVEDYDEELVEGYEEEYEQADGDVYDDETEYLEE